MRAPAESFRADLARLARNARARAVARRLVPSLAVGFALGLAFALARPFLPDPVGSWPSIAVTSAVAAAAGLVGLVLGLLARIDERAILIDADRALGTRELAGTALDLLSGSRRSIFSGVIVSEAAGVLRRARPRDLFGRLRLPMAPVAAVIAAAAIAASLLPFSLRDLFPRRVPRIYDLAFVGAELGDAGRRLGEAARASDLRRDLEIALDLEQLGADLEGRQVPLDELAERLTLLERDLAAELQERIRRARQAGEGRQGLGSTAGGTEGAATESGDGEPTGSQGTGSEPSATEPGSREEVPPDAEPLADALAMVQGMRKQLSPATGTQEAEQGGGSGQQPGASGAGRGAPAGSGESGENAPADPLASGAPGLTPQKDVRGPGSEIAKPQTSQPLQAEAQVGEGAMARMLVRALPESGRPRASEDDTLREYRRQAESALAAEQVPYELRGYVKDYFLGIGVIGK